MTTITIPRSLDPMTNPAGFLAAAQAVFALVLGIYNAVNHHGVLDSTVITSAVGAVAALFARNLVTPVADPRNSGGEHLVPISKGQ